MMTLNGHSVVVTPSFKCHSAQFLTNDILPKIKTLIKKPFSQSSPWGHFLSPVCWLLCLAEPRLQLLLCNSAELVKSWRRDAKKEDGGMNKRKRWLWMCIRVSAACWHPGIHILSLCGMWLPTSVGKDVWWRTWRALRHQVHRVRPVLYSQT